MKKNAIEQLNEIFPKSTAGSIIRAFRKNFNITLKEMEILTGIKEPNLSAIENDRMPLSKKSAELIGAALGISANRLIFPNGEDLIKKLKAIEKKGKALREKKKHTG